MWDSPVTVQLQLLSFHYRYVAPVTLIPSTCNACQSVKRTRRSRQSSIYDAYLMDCEQVTKDFLLIQCLPFFINLINFEKRYKPKGEIITVAKPYDLRYLMLFSSNNCVPPNLRQNPCELQDLQGFFLIQRIK